MGGNKLRAAAYQLAKDLVRPDIDRGQSLSYIQKTYHHRGGLGYSAGIVPGFKVHVTAVDGIACDYYFDLKKIYRECKELLPGQQSLF